MTLAVQESTQFLFSLNASFVPTVIDYSRASNTQTELDLTSVAAGAAEQSVKVDLGANRASAYEVMMAVEMASGVVSGETLDLYWAPSTSATANSGNVASVDGNASGVAPLNPSGSVTDDEFVAQCDYIGSLTLTDDITTNVQGGFVGVFSPSSRYGLLVVFNNSTGATHSDAVESHVVFNPIQLADV